MNDMNLTQSEEPPILPHEQNQSLLSYHGNLGGIYKVWIKNILLTIITLGIYRAWAKARMRKYIWAHIQLSGDRLQYIGTGRELFTGFVKVAILLFIIPTLIVFAVTALSEEPVEPTPQELSQIYASMEKCGYTHENWDDVTSGVYQLCLKKDGLERFAAVNYGEAISNIILLPLILYVVYFSRYSSLRYRLSRTTWRGIRGSMRGSANHYVLIALGRLLINIVSFGIFIPRSDMTKQAYIMRDFYLGTQKASFVSDISGLKSIHIITGLLAIPTLGFSRLWYRAALKNKKLANTSFGNIRFHGTYRGSEYAVLYLTNALLLMFSLGLALPFIIHRLLNFHVSNTILTGTQADMLILQDKAKAGNIGEGFAEEFDTGLDIDFGFI